MTAPRNRVLSSLVLTFVAPACVVVAVTVESVASAGELTPDTPGQDPNGPPPMPPPMPAPGQPGSVAPPPPAGSTEAHLDKSSQEDNGVGLKLFYVQPEIGYGYGTLGGALNNPERANVDFSQFRDGSGPAYGLGVGGEFITFQFGGRLRHLNTKNFNLWNIGGEIMFQPGSGRFWPRFGVTAGYAWAASFNQQLCGERCGDLSIGGLALGGRAGFQYFLTKHIEVGADATIDALLLKRDGVNISGYEAGASGTGMMLALLGHVGVHLP